MDNHNQPAFPGRAGAYITGLSKLELVSAIILQGNIFGEFVSEKSIDESIEIASKLLDKCQAIRTTKKSSSNETSQDS